MIEIPFWFVGYGLWISFMALCVAIICYIGYDDKVATGCVLSIFLLIFFSGLALDCMIVGNLCFVRFV